MADTKKTKQIIDAIQDYLTDNGDIDQLRDMAEEFNSLLEQEEKINTAIITTALNLDKAQKTQTEKVLKGIFGDDLDFEYVVNSNILGGMKIKVYDQVIDMSLDTTLHNISQNLKQ